MFRWGGVGRNTSHPRGAVCFCAPKKPPGCSGQARPGRASCCHKLVGLQFHGFLALIFQCCCFLLAMLLLLCFLRFMRRLFLDRPFLIWLLSMVEAMVYSQLLTYLGVSASSMGRMVPVVLRLVFFLLAHDIFRFIWGQLYPETPFGVDNGILRPGVFHLTSPWVVLPVNINQSPLKRKPKRGGEFTNPNQNGINPKKRVRTCVVDSPIPTWYQNGFDPQPPGDPPELGTDPPKPHQNGINQNS